MDAGTFVLKTTGIRSMEHLFPWWNFRYQDHSFPGPFVPWNFRSWDRSFTGTNLVHGRKGPEYLGRKFQGTNSPGNEWSREWKFHHGNKCSRERIVLRTNVPDTDRNYLPDHPANNICLYNNHISHTAASNANVKYLNCNLNHRPIANPNPIFDPDCNTQNLPNKLIISAFQFVNALQCTIAYACKFSMRLATTAPW